MIQIVKRGVNLVLKVTIPESSFCQLQSRVYAWFCFLEIWIIVLMAACALTSFPLPQLGRDAHALSPNHLHINSSVISSRTTKKCNFTDCATWVRAPNSARAALITHDHYTRLWLFITAYGEFIWNIFQGHMHLACDTVTVHSEMKFKS